MAIFNVYMKEVEEGVDTIEVYNAEQEAGFQCREDGDNFQEPQMKRLWNTNVVKQEIYFRSEL